MRQFYDKGGWSNDYNCLIAPWNTVIPLFIAKHSNVIKYNKGNGTLIFSNTEFILKLIFISCLVLADLQRYNFLSKTLLSLDNFILL